jgi:ribosomal protein L35AE/L33A
MLSEEYGERDKGDRIIISQGDEPRKLPSRRASRFLARTVVEHPGGTVVSGRLVVRHAEVGQTVRVAFNDGIQHFPQCLRILHYSTTLKTHMGKGILKLVPNS